MKGTLIRKAECWYNLYQEKIGFGSTHWELQGYKLCQKNCDEIFGIVDVEKLAEEWVFETNEHKWSNNDDTAGDNFGSYREGFNKAMELNGDKLFTLDDMLNAYIQGTNDGVQFESLMDYDSEDFDEAHEFAKEAEKEFRESLQQPTEIEVEIEMEPMNVDEIREQGKGFLHGNTRKPKLDENGCLILKKALLTERFK
jgi:uncharacterized Zn finger protein